MKKQEIRDLIDQMVGPFLKEEFGMVRLPEGSDTIYGNQEEAVGMASPTLLFILTGSDYEYCLQVGLVLSSVAVARRAGSITKGKKIYTLLYASFDRMMGKDRKYTFNFKTKAELIPYLETLIAFLRIEGREFWARFGSLASIEEYLNSDPTGNLEYATFASSRARDGLTLAKVVGNRDLIAREEEDLKLF